MAAGGQGAPLAPIYHQALRSYSNLSLPTAVLNLGGVGNVTVLTVDNELVASDTGPGNGPLDSWIAHNGLGNYDSGGRYALAGTPKFELVDRWLKEAFFKTSLPRSADRFDFDVLSDMKGLSAEDGAATLAAIASTARGAKTMPSSSEFEANRFAP